MALSIVFHKSLIYIDILKSMFNFERVERRPLSAWLVQTADALAKQTTRLADAATARSQTRWGPQIGRAHV
jgi:hypothetical protein